MQQEIQKAENQTTVTTYNRSTTVFLQRAKDLLTDDDKAYDLAKLEITNSIRCLMPAGKPDFDLIGANTPIAVMKHLMDNAALQTVLYALLIDFCDSLNVKQNMNRKQAMDCAVMLFDKCDLYRLEDYAVMFTMAKRGELIGTTYNKVDIMTIADIMKAYDAQRQVWVERKQDEEFKEFERQINEDSGQSEKSRSIGEALEISMKEWNEEKTTNVFPKGKNEYAKQIEAYMVANNISPEDLKNHIDNKTK